MAQFSFSYSLIEIKMVERLKWDIEMVRVYFRYNLKSYTVFYYVTVFSKKTDEGVLLSSSTAVA